MKCKYCGEEFEQRARGRKKVYCNKEECIRKAKNEAQKKYLGKIKKLKGTKYRIVEQKEEKKIVYSSTDRAVNSAKNEDFSDVIELARELGAVKFKITETLKKLQQEEQSKYDKNDQVFLHKLEEISKQEVVYADDIIKLVIEHIEKRQGRRTAKDKIQLLMNLNQANIPNPNAYVVQFLKNRDNRTYNPKIKEEKVGTVEK